MWARTRTGRAAQLLLAAAVVGVRAPGRWLSETPAWPVPDPAVDCVLVENQATVTEVTVVAESLRTVSYMSLWCAGGSSASIMVGVIAILAVLLQNARRQTVSSGVTTSVCVREKPASAYLGIMPFSEMAASSVLWSAGNGAMVAGVSGVAARSTLQTARDDTLERGVETPIVEV